MYDYLGERKVIIRAPEGLLLKIERNIEEPGNPSTDFDCFFEIEVVEEGSIIKDKSFPYRSVRKNNSLSTPGIDFLRYNTLVRTIWQKSCSEFFVRSYIQNDEDAFCKCFEKYLLEEASEGKILFHASTVESKNGGLTIPGRCWSGKTTLAVSFLEKLDLTFINDGDTLLDFTEKGLRGSYIPKPIYTRFSTIANSQKLLSLLNEYHNSEATQQFDEDALQKIILARKFDLDVGISSSRKKFCDLLKVNSKPKTNIKKIIFPEYTPNGPVSVTPIGRAETVKRLKLNAFPKRVDLHSLEQQQDIVPPEIHIPDLWIDEVKSVVVSYSGIKDLTRGLLEDLAK